MYATREAKLLGALYLAPALLFVLVFTVYPVGQLLVMSLNKWSIITPPEFAGFDNFVRAFSDRQFWTSLGFTLKYTLWITPILMVGGYLIALMVSANTPLRRFTRAVVFIPVVIGLGVSSLMWYWLFNYDFGLINRLLLDLGVTSEKILWFGADVDAGLWAVIISVVWKVIGFGMLLFVAAIQGISHEVVEATMMDGANYWQRVWRIVLPLTLKTVLLVTLVSVIGSLLAFDQFYIMTAGQPFNQTATSVFWIYLNSFPYLKLGYGAALSVILAAIVLTFTIAQMYVSRRSYS
ncbi:MAG: sugar ABC transporter permease [Cucumibacter sp.]